MNRPACALVLVTATALLTAGAADGADGYVARLNNSLSRAEATLFQAKRDELWNSEIPALFEIALVGMRLAHPPIALAGGPGPLVRTQEQEEELLLARFKVSKNPDIQGMILYYLPQPSSQRATEVAQRAFRESTFPKVRGAAFYALRIGHPKEEEAYNGFAREVIGWLSDPEQEVDLEYAIRAFGLWFEYNRWVQEELRRLSPERQAVVLGRFVEYLSSTDSNNQASAANAIARTGFRNAGSVLLETVDRLSESKSRTLEVTLIWRDGMTSTQDRLLSTEDWASPLGLRLLRKAMLGTNDRLARAAERLYVRSLSELLRPEEIQRQLMYVKLSGLGTVAANARNRLIEDLNKDVERVCELLRPGIGAAYSLDGRDLDLLKESGLHESIVSLLRTKE